MLFLAIPVMDFGEIVKRRRSVRSYDTSREIDDDTLKEIFELVKYSPSSYNLQPWEFIVVRDKSNKKRLRGCAQDQPHVEEASAIVIVLGNTDARDYAGEIADDRMKKGTMDAAKRERFEAAVARLAENRTSAKPWTIRSTSLAAMTLMLAAGNFGIASCPMEGFDQESVKLNFKIPDKYEVIMLIALGYQHGEIPERPMRFGFERIVHFEEFNKK